MRTIAFANSSLSSMFSVGDEILMSHPPDMDGMWIIVAKSGTTITIRRSRWWLRLYYKAMRLLS